MVSVDQLFAIDSLLTDTERQIRGTVRAFGEQRLRPHVTEWFEQGMFPARELAPELGALGLLGMHLDRYGCAGTSATEYGLACMELESVDSGVCGMVSVQGSIWNRFSPTRAPAEVHQLILGEALTAAKALR